MSFAEAMATMARLTASAEALAALGARLRADVENINLDPGIEAALDAALAELGVDPEGLAPQERATVALFSRAFLRQAADLLDHPERPPGWGFEDPVILLSQGRGSASVAAAFAEIEFLAEALGRDGAALLDVGAGVAALSAAFCARWPGLRVVGLEPWPFALGHARETVANAGLGDRITLRDQRIEDLADAETYDAIWLPGPFLAPEIVPAALERCHAALKPDGYLVFGHYAAPPDPLSQRLIALRTLRSGGRPTTEAEATAAMVAAGFADAHVPERTWAAPVWLCIGRRG